MPALTPEQVAEAASEMFNVISETHNAQVDEFKTKGVSRTLAAVASYVALRVMLVKFEALVSKLVEPESTPVIETIIGVMSDYVGDPGTAPTQPPGDA